MWMPEMRRRSLDPHQPDRLPSRAELRIAGGIAMVVALSFMWFASRIFDAVAFAPAVVGDVLVRAAPGDFATFFIDALKHWSMRLLIGAVLVGTVVVGAELLARLRGRGATWIAASVFGAAGSVAVLLGPVSGASRSTSAVVALLGAGVYGLVAARFGSAFLISQEGDRSRRKVLRWGLVTAAGVTLAGGVAGWLARRLGGPNTDVRLAAPVDAAVIPERSDFPEVDGITPEITSVDDHYVVDIDLFAPSVEADGWNLTVSGSVDRPLELSFSELQQNFEVVEEYSVLVCVSNEVGGDLIGHSRWGGVRLADVLNEAGIKPGAADVVFRAADGYSDSIPLDVALKPANLLAVSHNGRPLQQDHGFPCRVRVPSIYGMKNVKWLESIEVTDENYRGYWQRRGWSDVAEVKTQSRIDVPVDGDSIPAGRDTWIAGIAWAGERGIDNVEVSVDDGRTWREALVREPVARHSWHQWAYRWTPEDTGETEVMCRATDGLGRVQTDRETPPHPAGASGLHSIGIHVT